MTTAVKLWLGFGILTALLLFSGTGIALRLRSLDGNLRALTQTAAPKRAAAYEMETNILGAGLGVMKYLDTGDPAYRDRVAKDAGDFEKFRDRYDELTRTRQEKEASDRLANLFQRYKALGDRLMDQKDQQQALFAHLGQNFEAIDQSINQFQSRIDRKGADGVAKVEEAAHLEGDIAAVGAALGNYQRTSDPAFKERVFQRVKQFAAALERFRNLQLTGEEKTAAEELEKRFHLTSVQVKETLSLHEAQQDQVKEFLKLRTDLDDLLDQSIQGSIWEEFSAAEQSAERAVELIQASVLVLLVVGLLIAIGTSILVGRGIVKTEQTLRTTLGSIGDGVILTDVNRRVTYLNGVAQILTGWKQKEAREKPLEAICPIINEETRQPVQDPVHQVLQTDKPTDLVNHRALVAKDGTTRPIAGIAAPIRDAQGRMTGVVLTFHDISERQALEQDRARLLVQEQKARLDAEDMQLRYQALVDGLDAIVWEADAQTGQCTFVSKRVEKILGYPVESWQTESGFWGQLTHPDDREMVLEHFRTVTTDGGDHDFDYRAIAADGSVVWLRNLLSVIRDTQGKALYLRGVMVDITSRKHAEEALQQSEARYRNLLYALPVAVYTTDCEGRITLFNDQAAEMWGRRPEIGKEMWCGSWRIYDPNGAPLPLDQCPMATAIREGQGVRNQEVIVERPDGTQVWVLPHPEPLRDASGKIIGAVNMLVDITARKQAEEEIRESEARLRQLADAMPQMVWTAQPDGQVDYYNQRWYDYTGLPESQDNPSDWSSVLHPDDLQPSRDCWQEAFQMGQRYQTEYRFKESKSGKYRWHLCRALPARNRAGRILRWYGTCTDIDDLKRAEERLMIADRRKDEFLAVLSHELRNPLAPIRNALHLLRLGNSDDPDLTEAREVIERQVLQLSGIVDDLLDVFRIAHQKIQFHKEHLDLAGLVRQTVEDYRSGLEGSGLTLTVETPTKPVWVQGDRRRLCQVVTNLLHNAAKFSNSGDHVTVHLEKDLQHHRTMVSVRDTGVGITPEVLPHIFDTFAQAQQSLERRHGGLGLGLALVKGIVELHGGLVKASSAGPGHGAELTFWLPLSKAPKMITPPSPPAIVPAAQSLRILIVEDNQDTARTLSKLLRQYGHELKEAHTGTEGVNMAQEWLPDVVLCDLGLPEIDGYEVASTLRRDPATASMRLIAVSGYGQEEDRQRSEAAGFDLHLTKPVDPVELQRLLAVLKVG